MKKGIESRTKNKTKKTIEKNKTKKAELKNKTKKQAVNSHIKNFLSDFNMTLNITKDDQEKIQSFFSTDFDLDKIRKRRTRQKYLRGY